MLQFIAEHYYGFSDSGFWGYVIAGAIGVHITLIAITLYHHREQAHRSVDLHPALRHFFRFWLWMNTGVITREWVAVHRKHHAMCERDGDPHSPQLFGLKKVLLEGAELYRKEACNPETLEKYGRGTPDDWVETPYLYALAKCGRQLVVRGGRIPVRCTGHRAVRDPVDHHALACRRDHQRTFSCQGVQKLRDCGCFHQPVAPGGVRCRRRAAQQPPRVPEFRPILPSPVGGGPGLAAPAAVRGPWARSHQAGGTEARTGRRGHKSGYGQPAFHTRQPHACAAALQKERDVSGTSRRSTAARGASPGCRSTAPSAG